MIKPYKFLLQLGAVFCALQFSAPAFSEEIPASPEEAPVIAEEDAALHKPQLYDHNGAPVDPLCFLMNVGSEDEPVFPTVKCKWEELVGVDEAPLDPARFVGSAYTESFVDPETEEVHTYQGFTGYRAVGHVGAIDAGHEAVITIENGGGSGVFTTLSLLEMDKSEEGNTIFREHQIIAGGDRCMGGIEDAYTKDEKLYYSQNTTMADMLHLSGDPEREILKSEIYETLPYCAVCCYAEVHFDEYGFTNISFPEDRHKPDADNIAGTCVENLVSFNAANGKTEFSPSEFDALVREIEHVCLGRMEGE